MITRAIACAIACLAMSHAAAAAELAPGHGRSLHLGGFDGTVYYTLEPDGYHVVATMAPRTESPPIRFVVTLAPGQSMLISVPQAVGEPSIDLQLARVGDTLVIGDPIGEQAVLADE
jgi:hypothetical protein